MIFKKTLPKKTRKEVFTEMYAKLDTCCDCEIFLFIEQTYDYNYRIEPTYTRICDLHREAALAKHTDKVRSKLI